MKIKTLTKLLLAVVLFVGFTFSSFSAVNLTENFSGGPSSYTTGIWTFSNGLTWDLVSVQGETAANSVGGFGGAARFLQGVNSSIISPSINTCGTITFQYRELNAIGGGTFTVSKSVNGGAFTTIETKAFSGTTYATYTVAVNDASSNIKIKVQANSAATYLIVDEMQITDVVVDPTLSVSSSTLTGFNYIDGFGPSTVQSYNLSGTNLDGTDVTVTPSTNYEISLSSGSGFISTPITLTAFNGTSTPIYVRLKSGLAVTSYNSETIVNAGGGALSSVSVTCSGSVSPVPPAALSVSSSTLTGFTYIDGSGPSSSQSYNLSGTYLTGYPSNITVTGTTNYEVSLDNSTFSASVNVSYTSATLSSTPIYVRLKSGLAVASYNSEIITNAGGGSSAVNVTCSGSVSAIPPATLSVSSSTLTGFTYITGSGPSASQTYNLSGTYLTGYPGSINLTAPTNYEISTDNSVFMNSLNVSYTSATLTSTTIYVRLKSGLGVASYNSEIIANAGGGASTVNVTCSGSVTAVPPATLSVSSSTLTGFTYEVGSGPSTSQTYNLSGSNLTGAPSNIVVTGSTNYEVSLDNATFGASVNVAYTSGTLSSTPVYVRLKSGLIVGSYNSEIVANAGGGASALNVTCSGAVTDIPVGTPNVIITEVVDASSYLASFIEIHNAGAVAQDISGWQMFENGVAVATVGTVTLQPCDYLVFIRGTLADLEGLYGTYTGNYYVASTSQIGNGSDYFELKDAGGVVVDNMASVAAKTAADKAYERVDANSDGTTLSTDWSILATRDNATPGKDNLLVLTNEACGGGTPSPTLTSSSATLTGFTYVDGSGPSSEQTFTLSGTLLDGTDVTITPSTNYEVSLTSGSGFVSTPLTLTAYDGTSTPVYVRLIAGLGVASYNSEVIAITGGGASALNVTCSGDVTAIPSPTLAVSASTLTGFTYVTGAGPSSEQTFTLSGANLDGTDATITPSTNYEVSLTSGSGFVSSPLTLTAYDGTSTPVYVRLKSGLAIASYNSEVISITGGGSIQVDVTCDGSVTDVVVGPCLEQLTFTALPTGWAATSITYSAGEAVFGAVTGDLATVVVSNPSSLDFDLRRTTNTSAKTLTVEVSTTDQASGYTVVATYDLTNTTSGGTTACTVDLSAYTSSSSVYIKLVKTSSTTSPWYVKNFAVTCGSSTPVPTLTSSSATLTGFTYVDGSGPSSEQTFTLSGTLLDGTDVTITPSTNYEVSLTSGSGFVSTPLTLTAYDGTSTPVYVRLIAGLGVASYNSEVISITGGGASALNVTCSGDVTAIPSPTIAVSASTLTGFTYIVDLGPSVSQSFDVSGTTLSAPGSILVTAPVDYEVSIDDVTFASSVNVDYTTATLNATPIYVRLKATLVIADYNLESITLSTSGAVDVTVVCSGSVTDVLTDCGNETFTNIPTTSSTSYLARTWTGDDGKTWIADSARTDQVITALDKAITFKGSLTSPLYTTGVGDITVTTKFPFADGTFDLPVLVNGVQVGTVPVSTTETTTTLSGINIAGDAVVKFQSNGLKRPAIDNLTWTCYTMNTENITIEKGLSIYPNPNNGNFTVELENGNEISEISIVDITGKEIYRNTKISRNEIQLNVDSGIYFVIVKADKQMVRKIIVK